jgi:hypothetical protein
MPSAHQNWQSLGASGLYGGNTAYGPTGSAGVPVTHSQLDALRIGQGRTPEAEYPDGYLGTIRSRRDDRLLDSLKNRVNQRAYQRGVHKGERIDQSDYFYPKGLDPQRGIRNQARGKKTGPLLELAPAPHLVNDGKANIVANEPAQLDPKRTSQLSSLRPAWR